MKKLSAASLFLLPSGSAQLAGENFLQNQVTGLFDSLVVGEISSWMDFLLFIVVPFLGMYGITRYLSTKALQIAEDNFSNNDTYGSSELSDQGERATQLISVAISAVAVSQFGGAAPIFALVVGIIGIAFLINNFWGAARETGWSRNTQDTSTSFTSTDPDFDLDTGENSQTPSDEEVQEELDQTEEVLDEAEEERNRNQQELQDEEEKAKELEARFRQLKNRPFEEAAREFINDENMPEKARKEMKDILERFEKEENEEKKMIEVIEEVIQQQELELRKLAEIEQVEERILDELAEIEEEEEREEKQLGRYAQQYRDLHSELEENIETYREAVKQGNNQAMQQTAQRIKSNRRQLDELEARVDKMKERIERDMSQEFSVLERRLQSLREKESEVETQENQTDSEIETEASETEELSENDETMESELDDEENYLSGHQHTEQEGDDVREVRADVRHESELTSEIGAEVREEADEQSSIEDETARDEQATDAEAEVTAAEEQRAEELDAEATELEEEIEQDKAQAEKVIEEGQQAEQISEDQLSEQAKEIKSEIQKLSASNNRDNTIPYYYRSCLLTLMNQVEIAKKQYSLEAASNLLEATSKSRRVVDGAMSERRNVKLFDAAITNKQPEWNGNPDLEKFGEMMESPDDAREETEKYLENLDSKLDSEYGNFIELAPLRKVHDRLVELYENSGTSRKDAANYYAIQTLIKASFDAFDREEIREVLNSGGY